MELTFKDYLNRLYRIQRREFPNCEFAKSYATLLQFAYEYTNGSERVMEVNALINAKTAKEEFDEDDIIIPLLEYKQLLTFFQQAKYGYSKYMSPLDAINWHVDYEKKEAERDSNNS